MPNLCKSLLTLYKWEVDAHERSSYFTIIVPVKLVVKVIYNEALPSIPPEILFRFSIFLHEIKQNLVKSSIQK
jgi:hypothetical protein